MATIKVKFRPSTVANRPGSIIYLVTHKRVVRQITSALKVFHEEWDENEGNVVPVRGERYGLLISAADRLRSDLERLDAVIARLEIGMGDFSADDVVRGFFDKGQGMSLFPFMKTVIADLGHSGRERTSEIYEAALKSFMSFRKDRDILLAEIDSDTIVSYEAYLKSRNIAMNTISFYNRVLRAVYNRAVEKDLTVQRYPFRHVYTGIGKTVKRAIPLCAVKRIKELDLSRNPSLDFARDMFMFSFYTRGMSFVDMAYAKKSDLKNGALSYNRRKTGQRLVIRWEDCMQGIVDKYSENSTDYLLPIIKNPDDGRRQYRNALKAVNGNLKTVAVLAGIQTGLTMYVARHSWASIAHSQNIPISIISEGMGHDSETTTRIYLASLDNSIIDNANDLILRNL